MQIISLCVTMCSAGLYWLISLNLRHYFISCKFSVYCSVVSNKYSCQ